jgi:cation channel sperm-associated protein 4
MFSLFICVTQDGWMSINNELNRCGNSILGAIYLVIFITIGAFVFANLVVAVVVTNLVRGEGGVTSIRNQLTPVMVTIIDPLTPVFIVLRNNRCSFSFHPCMSLHQY